MPSDLNQNTGYYAMCIDPTQGEDPYTQNLVGTVVQAVDLGAFLFDGNYHGPYNYSDMTGFVTLGTTQPAGVWDFVEDSATDYTLWSSVNLEGDLNSGNIIIEVRAADRITDLPSWPFRRLSASTGTIPLGAPPLKGHYLETRVTLLRSFGAAQSPVVRSLSLAWGTPGSHLQISQHPQSQIVNLGDSAPPFTVSATPTGLSYQWYKDGNAVAGQTASTLNLGNVSATDAGLYHVRVTDASGVSLDSADARLHVNSTPYYAISTATVDNSSPLLGHAVNFDASMDITPSPGPVWYQWRKNGVPIPGQSGQCTTTGYPNYDAGRYTTSAVACADTASYSVVFTNAYWKVASAAAAITVQDQPQVAITLSYPMPITDIHNPPTLTATTCVNTNCQQWYWVDSTYGGYYFKIPIPNATGLKYTLPNPVTCDSLGPEGPSQNRGSFLIEVFDESHIPHASSPITVYGACQ